MYLGQFFFSFYIMAYKNLNDKDKNMEVPLSFCFHKEVYFRILYLLE